MSTVSVDINNYDTWAVTHARQQHNAEYDVDNPRYCADNDAFIKLVIAGAVASWKRSFPPLTRRKVFVGLSSIGKLEEVQALVATQDDVIKFEWEVADLFERSNAMLNQMWGALPSNAGKTQEQLDEELNQLFTQFADL